MLNPEDNKPVFDQDKPTDAETLLMLPVDKMIIVILVLLIISLMVLSFSHLVYQLGFFPLTERAAWAGWGSFISAVIFLFASLPVKGFESILLNRFNRRLSQNIFLNTKTGKKQGSNSHIFLPYGVITVLLALSISLTAHGMTQALRLPRVKNVIIRLDKLPPDFEGIRIVQLTDLHISSSGVGVRSRLEKMVKKVNGLMPDIIALTGDIIDAPHAQIHEKISPLSQLKARLGKYFVTGNHEYLHGADQCSREMEGLGFTVLCNEHRLIPLGSSELIIGGIPDSWGDSQRPDLAAAAGKKEDALIKILLAHRPDSVYKAEPAGFDLQLSGHTHGCQIGFFRFLRSVVQPFQSGLYTFKTIKVYVSNGAGYVGIPLRFGAPSEISLIELTGIKEGSKSVRVDRQRFRVVEGW